MYVYMYIHVEREREREREREGRGRQQLCSYPFRKKEAEFSTEMVESLGPEILGSLSNTQFEMLQYFVVSSKWYKEKTE